MDTIFDALIPYRPLSRSSLKDIIFPTWIPGHYVLNQKMQRAQMLCRLRAAGIDNPEKLKIWWSRGLDNFGDELMPYLLGHTAGIDCQFDRHKSTIAIGSTIRFAHNHTTIWGSGILKQNETMSTHPRILAVRGPLTRKKMIANGIECPEVYGDPALLFPLFYPPKSDTKTTQTLIAPHFKHTALMKAHESFDYLDLHVHAIREIENIIDKITSAPCVLTSSLHVFIFCVAYGIPVAVFKLEEQGIGGDNIKFDDFCSGAGIAPITIHTLDNDTPEGLKELSAKARTYKTNWSPLPLLESLRPLCDGPALSAFIEKQKSQKNAQQSKQTFD